ncbi:MAG: hypothetical protein C6I00_03835 [Nitratiruptor sp.]|nr:hypothetical protein [Nitratiruptor sp.]NPA83913.1 protein-disulfide reductase DsbD [Campylobacterota bacterium]
MRHSLIWIILVTFLFGFGFVEVGKEGPQITPVEEAYKPSLQLEGDRIRLRIEMAPKVYLYQKELKLRQIAPSQRELPLQLPPPQELHGEPIYQGSLEATIPLEALDTSQPSVELELSYQGCNEIGVCYPPQRHRFTIALPKELEQASQGQEPPQSQGLGSEEGEIVDLLKHRSIWAILGTFYLLGLLLAFTPCIFPMIPILSSLIVGSKGMTTKRAFLYSLVYVLAMAITYTIAGLLAGLFGANLQAAFQNPVVITLFALLFVALALSMFGFYEIGLPASLQTKLAQKSDAAGSRGGIIGVALMGLLSALIVGPCVAPPLAGALIYIGQTGDALLGGSALFAMSLGMGTPLLLIGTGAGKFMPKPGGWMEAINRVFGVVMLGVAIWMLERILPPGVTMFLWGSLFIGSAVYLRALEPLPQEAPWFAYFKKSVGIILFLYGLFVLLGAFTGGLSPLDPLRGVGSAQERSQEERLFQPVNSLAKLEEILSSAQKPVLLDVTAQWCTSCKELDALTFSNPRVRRFLQEHFIPLRFDVSDNSKEDKELLRRFNLFGPPAILIFVNGKEVDRIIGFIEAEEFLKRLERVVR